jgi:iron complex transport system substrate-binding protein
LEPLEQAGLTVACFNVTNFAEYLNMLEICTTLTGKPEAYDHHGLALKTQIEAAKARSDGSAPTVLYIRATGSSCKVKNSRDTVLGEMLSDLGCVNIADSEDSLLEQLSLEQIIRSAPDYIFAVLQGADSSAAEQTLEATLLSNPAWQSLTAVREGRFHVLEHRLYNLKPNARWGEAYEKLADILYPAP